MNDLSSELRAADKPLWLEWLKHRRNERNKFRKTYLVQQAYLPQP